MKRLVLAAALIALPCAAASAGPRAIAPVEAHAGIWTVEYWITGGPYAMRTDAAGYAKAVKAGSCGSASHVTLWPRSKTVTIVCEGD